MLNNEIRVVCAKVAESSFPARQVGDCVGYYFKVLSYEIEIPKLFTCYIGARKWKDYYILSLFYVLGKMGRRPARW